ncbi:MULTISPECIES: hypothetical protein [unclassified Rhodanobacter]|uniref:hypothetical protein n=1 Tax=unclassified Rhodanobacter TaxID=2621553 RepID=UPI001BDDE6BC|nr:MULTISPECIES: hypothetical protein [unclassified Rhodanobacter]MBT2142718.1 hypothetical protein [Rhodanobacter sp. LX-99]MBT2148209.1 hypothetical protein [Rhodanobacter sp. LX-100]
MDILWASGPIQIRDELHADVKATASTVILGTYNDAVQASDLVLTPDQARTIACALIEGADAAEAAREG